MEIHKNRIFRLQQDRRCFCISGFVMVSKKSKFKKINRYDQNIQNSIKYIGMFLRICFLVIEFFLFWKNNEYLLIYISNFSIWMFLCVQTSNHTNFFLSQTTLISVEKQRDEESFCAACCYFQCTHNPGKQYPTTFSFINYLCFLRSREVLKCKVPMAYCWVDIQVSVIAENPHL